MLHSVSIINERTSFTLRSKVLPEDLPKDVKISRSSTLKYRILQVSIQSGSKLLGEVIHHFKLINSLELHTECIKTTLFSILKDANHLLVEHEFTHYALHLIDALPWLQYHDFEVTQTNIYISINFSIVFLILHSFSNQ